MVSFISNYSGRFTRSNDRSELVTQLNPIMPIGDGLLCRLVRLDGSQLGQRDSQGSFFPRHGHEHFASAFVCGGQRHDFQLLAFASGRDCPVGDTTGAERKMQTLFQRAVPSHRLLLGPIGIHDYFLLDAVLPL